MAFEVPARMHGGGCSSKACPQLFGQELDVGFRLGVGQVGAQQMPTDTWKFSRRRSRG